jgi:hypothetical protein
MSDRSIRAGWPAAAHARSLADQVAQAISTSTLDAGGWGWATAIGLAIAVALVLIAVSFNGSRAQTAWAEPVFWCGVTLLFVPAAIRQISAGASRGERIAITVVLGLGLYLVKVLYSPVRFTFFDELQHYRTANDIARSGWLFAENPILGISPVFPALEIVTQALTSLGGLSIFDAGLIVIGAGRLVLVLALFLFYERATASPRIAGVAVLLYMANPHFVLFDAQYGYESLGLGLAVLTLYLAIRYDDAARTGEAKRAWLGALLILTLMAVITSHHVTSYLLTALLALWTLVRAIRNRGEIMRFVPGGLALLSLAGCLFWLFFVASKVVDYLGPQVAFALRQITQLIANERPPRQIFEDSGGVAVPLLVRVTGIASIGFILLGMPLGLREIWRKYRMQVVVLTLALASLAYPATLALRLTPWGLQVGSRMAPYLFVAVALVLGIGAAELTARRAGNRLRMAFAAWAVVIFVGTVSSAISAWGMPGPYVARAYTRSIDTQSVVTAVWARETFGPANRTASEAPMLWIMGAYGEQRPVTPDADNVYVESLFTAQTFSDQDRQLLRQGRVRFLSVDGRVSPNAITRGVAAAGASGPINPAMGTKFDGLNGVSRISDSGDLVVYDTRGVTDAK